MTATENLPQSLKQKGLFCVWRYETVKGRKTKMPYNPKTGGKAQSNNPATFAPLAAAEAVQAKYDGLGVGIFNGLCAVDIDHCIDSEGKHSETAQEIAATMDSYTEISPSGTGLRILFYATAFQYDKARYYINNQKLGLEIYAAGVTKKYVTVTGISARPGREIEERSAQLQTILDKYMIRGRAAVPTPTPVKTLPLHIPNAEKLLAKAHRGKNGHKFRVLWNGEWQGLYQSQSEADVALCNMLAFWTGKDPAMMDELFRVSGLMRDKWDRAQSGTTYGALTIQNSINSCTQVYAPQAHFAKKVIKRKVSGRSLVELKPEDNERYGWHDMGNGYLFADWYKDIARYVPERKKWFVYDGRVWRADIGDLRVSELCKRLADDLAVYALSIKDEKRRKDYMDHVSRWQRRTHRKTIIDDAASVYPVEFSEFDKDPLIFNCLNCTLNLETREYWPHRGSDMLAKIAYVNYIPDAKSPRWERFIDEVMQGDADKAAFLQKALGYSLTGNTHLECFFILYGPSSRNGKGTCMETYIRMMGDYGKTAKPDTISQRHTPNGSGPSEDIARLVGSRFVNMSEPDKKMVFSAATVKTLTGNDTITARYLHENSFEYRPQFKLFINTNYLPAVTDVTLFSSGRVKVIPFERHFTEDERDEGLKAELRKPESLSGILNWCLDGLWLINETGFTAPESVINATNEYRKSSDKIGRFLEDEMEKNPFAETRTAEAYERYRDWCQRNGHGVESAANFKLALSSYAEIKRKRPIGASRETHPTHMLIGYKLLPFSLEDFAS